MIGYYYLITSVSLSEAKLRTVCLEPRICVLNLMSVNNCVYQAFVLKKMVGAISAIRSRFGHFWSEFMLKTWRTVV